MKKEIDFKKFSTRVNGLLVNKLDVDALNDLYIDWTEFNRNVFNQTVEEFVKMRFQDWTLDKNNNALK